MGSHRFEKAFASAPDISESDLVLRDGSKVAVLGGGPAGSFFSYFLLDMAERVRLDLQLDIYEPRDFSHPAPQGCNMCGGIISESLVQYLAAEGINLPPTVVQRGIDSYVMHMDVGSSRIDTPLHEKRIGAVHRGGGPRSIQERKWDSFDGHLLELAQDKGAQVISGRVNAVSWVDGWPQLHVRNQAPKIYDLLAVACGVNTFAPKLFEGWDNNFRPPRTTKAAIREYYLGMETIQRYLGNSMHVFLLDIPRLEFAALIPKGDYVTVCLLGESIDANLVDAFLNAPQVKKLFPSDWSLDQLACNCFPRINVRGAAQPYGNRIVFVGDCGVSRLYKDGIGASYRTAKAAATAAVFQGISVKDFQQHYWPACQAIETDNNIGKLIFIIVRQIQRIRFARRALLRMVKIEQGKVDGNRRMSTVLWDTFTGSAPYREVFLRTLHPKFLGSFLWNLAVSAVRRQ